MGNSTCITNLPNRRFGLWPRGDRLRFLRRCDGERDLDFEPGERRLSFTPPRSDDGDGDRFSTHFNNKNYIKMLKYANRNK